MYHPYGSIIHVSYKWKNRFSRVQIRLREESLRKSPGDAHEAAAAVAAARHIRSGREWKAGDETRGRHTVVKLKGGKSAEYEKSV